MQLTPPEPDTRPAAKLDLIECLQRGYVRSDEELPALSLYGWAMKHLDHEPGEWDEERIHLSDYKYALEPEEGGCERQLWHRLRQDERKAPTLWMRMMWDQGFALQIRASWLICQGLPEEWSLRAVEMDVSEGLPYDHVGSCDLVLEAEMSVLGVEFKTQRGRAFRYLDEPKDSHVMQSQAELYALRQMYPSKEVTHQLVYLDREGQNEPLTFDTWEDDVRIEGVADDLEAFYHRAQKGSVMAPDPLDPVIEVRENKGPNSIYLKELWPCRYCDYKGQSCPGALEPELTENGIVAKGDHEDVSALDWKVNGELQERMETAVARAVQSGNVKSK